VVDSNINGLDILRMANNYWRMTSRRKSQQELIMRSLHKIIQEISTDHTQKHSSLSGRNCPQ
jgi:hypothetical protein